MNMISIHSENISFLYWIIPKYCSWAYWIPLPSGNISDIFYLGEGLVPEWRNSIASVLELRLSCIILEEASYNVRNANRRFKILFNGRTFGVMIMHGYIT